MVDAENLIHQIISKCKGVSKEEILKRLEDKRKEIGCLISDDVLLQIIATEFGVEVPCRISPPTLLIGHLVPGLSDVTVVGSVIAVFPPKILEGNKKASVASLLIADKSGVLRVVLWKDKAFFASSNRIKVGQIVRFSHGYTKENRWGNVELHIGEKGEVEIEPNDIKDKNFPKIIKFSTSIGAITHSFKNKRVNLIGKIKKIFQTSSFMRQDSTVGKVMRLILTDETGEIPVVVWNEKVDDIEKRVREGLGLYIVNAKVKKAVGEGLEVHVDSGTYINVFIPMLKVSKIAQLEENLKRVNVEGEVTVKPMIRNVKTSKGETVKLAVFEIKDGTGKIWVSAWRKNAEIATNLKVGDKVVIKRAYVKRGFGDQLEISTKSTTSIEIL
ncbi:MAG: OB-fold nucleic acid binding domain-containing protein [Candidatus Bathyarchaeia archaeon]